VEQPFAFERTPNLTSSNKSKTWTYLKQCAGDGTVYDKFIIDGYTMVVW